MSISAIIVISTMDQLKHTCSVFTTTICSALIGCDKDSIDTLKLLLQCAVQTILKQQQCDGDTLYKTLPPNVLQTSQSIIAATSSAPFPATTAKHIFYSHHQFPQLADVLLTFIAPTYLDTFFSQSEKDDLFYIWFQQAPTLSLLLTLSDQLTMEIGYINTSRSSTRITTAAGEFTSQLLETYFSCSSSSSSSSFIQDIITQLSQSNSVDEDTIEKLSIALSSLIDKSAPYYDTCPSIQPDIFIPTIITNLLHIDDNNNNIGLKLLADLMTRLSRRGHVAIVDTTLMNALQQQQERNIANIQQCIKMAEDSHGLGVLLLSMITQSSSSVVPILPLVLPRSTWTERTDIQQLTTNTWLRHHTLHPTAINQLLDYLHHTIDSSSDDDDQQLLLLLLPGIAARLAVVWGDVSGTIQVMPVRQQACITYIIVQCLKRMDKQQVELYPRLLMSVLSGVSARLESPLIVVKKQGMRVGDALSLVLEPGKKPLFHDVDDDNNNSSSSTSDGDDVIIGCPEEQWWSDVIGTGDADNGKTTRKKNRETVKEKTAPRKGRNVSRNNDNNNTVEEDSGGGGVLTETDSDDDGIISITSSDSEFEQYDISDSDSDDDNINNDGGKHSHIQLRDLPKMLTKGVDGKDTQGWKDQALRLTESLVRASPDELPMHAESLAKALLYAQLPKWLDEEMKPASGSSTTAEGQRFKNMVALLVEVPEPAGLTIASHLYSPSLDMHQRVLALSALSTAAEELAHPGKHLAITTRKVGSDDDEERRRMVSSGMTVDGQQRIGRVTWMAQQTLANLQQQQEMMKMGTTSSGQYVPTTINRFPSVALKWAAALLKECDVQKHGVDLFGRDAFLLGKLLTTLGTFIECCSGTTSAQPLALATMELLHSPRIHDHPEPFVRRAALLLAGHVVSQGVPPSLLASAALLLSSSSSSRDTNNISSSSIITSSTISNLTIATGIDNNNNTTTTEETAVRLLHWLMQWVESVADKDKDATCRNMGASVKNLSSGIAAHLLIGDKEGYYKNHEVRITGLGDNNKSRSGGGGLSIKGPSVSIPR